MMRIGMAAAVVGALVGCTSVRMVERDGCWLKQTEKWPSRVNEELAFCKKAAPAPAQDPLARLVQECVAQADYRWENRAIDAWNRDLPIPPRDSDEKVAASCMTEAAAALGPEAERAALKARLTDLDKATPVVVTPIAAPTLAAPQPAKPATSSAPCAAPRKSPADKAAGKPVPADASPNCEKAVAKAPSPRAG